MHRTLKAEATRPARRTAELQQRAFNQFRRVYNEERPHEALDMQPPASLYHPAEKRMLKRLAPLSYPDSYQTRRVNRHGQIQWRNSHYFVSETLCGQTLGLEFEDDGTWNIYFGPALLAELDDREGVIRRTGKQRHRRP
jgi:putative transposase